MCNDVYVCIHITLYIFYWKRIRQTFKRFSSTIVSLKLRAHQEERAEYYWLDLGVGGYIYEVVEGWVAGVEGGEGDAVGGEVIVGRRW